MGGSTIVKNRKARFEYEILETYEAGIALLGTEVKSLRAGKVKVTEAYCHVNADLELELREMRISPYEQGNRFNHQPCRVRKLLMHKKEIRKLLAKVREKGLTLIPLSLYFKQSRVKAEIGVCRGKKIHDKRASMKERDARREIARDAKNS